MSIYSNLYITKYLLTIYYVQVSLFLNNPAFIQFIICVFSSLWDKCGLTICVYRESYRVHYHKCSYGYCVKENVDVLRKNVKEYILTLELRVKLISILSQLLDHLNCSLFRREKHPSCYPTHSKENQRNL